VPYSRAIILYQGNYNPKVTIVKSGSTYKMKVDGVSKAVGVVKLK